MASPKFDVLTATAASLQDQLTTGALTSVDIVEGYCDQIEKHNNVGFKLNAIIAVAPRDIVLAQARAFDEERKNGKIRGPLHGLPIIVKDCFHLEPGLGLGTTAGAYCFVGEKSKETATVIQQLIEKGMIILGTANLSEFCGHKAENMSHGWSAVGGQPRSAYDTQEPGERKLEDPAPCGGSSSGSGVGVSAGFAPLSLGTETGGSLVYPASKAGLFAMKPTNGTVSSSGVFRISRSFDGIGAMAKTPADLAMLIESILIPEARDKLPADGYKGTVIRGWEGLRVGMVESTWGTGWKDKWSSEPVKSKYEGVVSTLRDHGLYVIYPALPPGASSLKHKGLTGKEVAFYEFNTVIREFCDGFENAKVRNLSELINYNEANAQLAMPEPHPNQKDLIASLNSPLSADEANEAYLELKRMAGKDGMEKYMNEHNLDLMIGSSDCNLISFSASAGWPSSTVPLGQLENGLPYGLFIIARANREDLIFRFMSSFEATFPRIKGPTIFLS